MPCYDPRDSDEYQAAENLKEYGEALSDRQLLQEVACRMGRILARSGTIPMDLLVLTWMVKEAKRDAERGQPWT